MAGTATVTGPVTHRSRGTVAIKAAVTVDASGDLSSTLIGVAFGRLVGFLYDGGLDASANISLLDGQTGAVIFGPYVTGTEGTPVFLSPTGAVVSSAGAAISDADTAPNLHRPILVAGKLNLLVSAGGTDETCVVKFIFDESDNGELALTV